MINKKYKILFLLAIFLITTKDVFANAGTPLMWVGMLHLLVGNAFIGAIEGLLIAKIFKIKKTRSIFIMILANYISMIAGSMIVGYSGYFFSNLVTIYWVHLFLFISFVIVFLLTVLIEWPFCYWILKKNTSKRKKSLKASLYAQILSYTLLIPFYFLASGTSLLWNVDIEKDLSFAQTNPWVYFISEDGDQIGRICLTRENYKKIKDIKKVSEYARLFPKKEKGEDRWDLWLIGRNDGTEIKQTKILDDFSLTLEPPTRWDGKIVEKPQDSWMSTGIITDYRDIDKRDWEIDTGFWAVEGLKVKNEKEGKEFRIALETPFIQWYIQNATILPGDQVVFQLGNQVVLLDIESRKLGLISKGKGPIVIPD